MPKVTFLPCRDHPEPITVEADAFTTLLEAAQKQGVHMGSSCGGVCACSTCHVYVVKGMDNLSSMEDKEADRLDMAFDQRANSRLGCQCILEKGDVELQLTAESLKAWHDEHPDG